MWDPTGGKTQFNNGSDYQESKRQGAQQIPLGIRVIKIVTNFGALTKGQALFYVIYRVTQTSNTSAKILKLSPFSRYENKDKNNDVILPPKPL